MPTRIPAVRMMSSRRGTVNSTMSLTQDYVEVKKRVWGGDILELRWLYLTRLSLESVQWE
jgi:hypothetical protein